MTREDVIRLKKSKKMSVTKLSELSGVPVGTITKIISGETRNPRKDTMAALEKVLCDDHLGGDLYPYDCEGGSSESFAPAPVYANMLRERAVSYGVAKKKQGQYTFADLEALPEGAFAELIDGYIYDMATPTYVHQKIAMEIYDQIRDFIRKENGSCEVFVNSFGVFADQDDRTYMIPDLSIVCDRDKITEKGIMGAPDFVLEILSPSTAAKDQGHKCMKYVQCGVKEYWIIDPKNMRLTAYRLFGDYRHYIGPMQGYIGIAIYDDQLKIDMDRVAAIVRDVRL